MCTIKCTHPLQFLTCSNGFAPPKMDLAERNFYPGSLSSSLCRQETFRHRVVERVLSFHLHEKSLAYFHTIWRVDELPRIISTADTNGKRSSNNGSNCPKLQSFSAWSLRCKLSPGLPKACESRSTRTEAPAPIPTLTKRPPIWSIFNHFRSLTCKYQTPMTNMMRFPDMTAIVPAIEIPAFEGALLEGSCHTHAIGSVAGRFLIVDMRRKIPDTQERTVLSIHIPYLCNGVTHPN